MLAAANNNRVIEIELPLYLLGLTALTMPGVLERISTECNFSNIRKDKGNENPSIDYSSNRYL